MGKKFVTLHRFGKSVRVPIEDTKLIKMKNVDRRTAEVDGIKFSTFVKKHKK